MNSKQYASTPGVNSSMNSCAPAATSGCWPIRSRIDSVLRRRPMRGSAQRNAKMMPESRSIWVDLLAMSFRNEALIWHIKKLDLSADKLRPASCCRFRTFERRMSDLRTLNLCQHWPSTRRLPTCTCTCTHLLESTVLLHVHVHVIYRYCHRCRRQFLLPEMTAKREADGLDEVVKQHGQWLQRFEQDNTATCIFVLKHLVQPS